MTWRCQWRCRHCFYRWNTNLHIKTDAAFADLCRRVVEGHESGFDHCVLTGFGEPTLYPRLDELIEFCHETGMAISIITNGQSDLGLYAWLHAAGVDHLHISTHGIVETLGEITDCPTAWERQVRLKLWCAEVGWKYRVNATLQRANYRSLKAMVDWELGMKDCQLHHYVFLGFLPHYEWQRHGCLKEVAVHPADLRPHIEAAAELLLEAGTPFSIRYHPLCHLDDRLWPYVTNARYVYFDPWEWNYTGNCTDAGRLWREAAALGESVAIAGEPCASCAARRHCGGWNRHYAAAFDGAGLAPVREAPSRYSDVWDRDGGLFDLNPANAATGTIGR